MLYICTVGAWMSSLLAKGFPTLNNIPNPINNTMAGQMITSCIQFKVILVQTHSSTEEPAYVYIYFLHSLPLSFSRELTRHSKLGVDLFQTGAYRKGLRYTSGDQVIRSIAIVVPQEALCPPSFLLG